LHIVRPDGSKQGFSFRKVRATGLAILTGNLAISSAFKARVQSAILKRERIPVACRHATHASGGDAADGHGLLLPFSL
jgi:hypothetical protein